MDQPNHLEIEAVRVLVAGAVAGLPGADHLGEHLALGRRGDAEITVGEMRAQADLPVGVFGFGVLEVPFGEAGVERLRGRLGGCGHGHP